MTWCGLKIAQCAQVLHCGTWNKNDHASQSTGTEFGVVPHLSYSHAELTPQRDDTSAEVNQYVIYVGMP